VLQNARDTYDGTVIKVKHRLKVKVQTQYFSDNLSVHIPLQIGNPDDSTPPIDGATLAALASPVSTDEDLQPPHPMPTAPQEEIPFVLAVPIDIPADEEITVMPVVEATAFTYGATAPVEFDLEGASSGESRLDGVVAIPPPAGQ